MQIFADGETMLKAATNYKKIPVETAGKIDLPPGYHEGIFVKGGKVFVNNGEKGNTWVLDIVSGKITDKINPVGTFTEGITEVSEGKYWVTDWNDKKCYLVRIENNKMIAEKEILIGENNPAGVVWDGSNLFIITWDRGMGMKYRLLKMDGEGNLVLSARIKGIHEPSQLAWDGENLWISSWYGAKVYKVDPATLEIEGYFISPVGDTTGIAWDGEYFWLTGTNSDLYKLRVGTEDAR